MVEPRRQDDILMGQLIQKIQDSIELSNYRERTAIAWRQEHDDESKAWRLSIDARIKPLEDWLLTANSSWKLVIGTITITGMLFKAWEYVRSHWH